jgi:molybdopterin synthase catalytic subunit
MEVVMVDGWIKEIKANTNPEELGMLLVHNGVVRATSKAGKPVKGMKLSYDAEMLEAAVKEMKAREGIAEVKAWLNQGQLKIGDDIMFLLVAGRFRTDVLPVLQELLTTIKTKIVKEEEIQ